jgi:DNA modification methylase
VTSQFAGSGAARVRARRDNALIVSWEIITGDALEVMSGMPVASADAIVTSPPYADQRDYRRAAEGATGRRVTEGASMTASRRQRRDAPMEFVEAFAPVLEEMLRVCSPAGSLMLNLGVIMRDGEEHPYADEILLRARRMGWRLLHRMVWHKPNSIPLSHPTYLHIKHEWVSWLAPTVDAYRGFDRDTRAPHSETSLRRIEQPYLARKDQRYMRRGKTNGLHPDGARPASVFTAAVGGESGIDHPAVMSLKLALQLVSLACRPGGLVLDPYAGSGTTGVAALRRDRSFVGVELEPRFAELARERIIADAPLLNAAAMR